MKRKISIIYIIIYCLFFGYTETSYKTYLDNFFQSSDYIIEQHKINNRVIYFAYNKISSKLSIFNMGIFYYKNEKNIIQPVLFIKNNIIITESGDKLFEAIIKTQQYYGWTIHVIDKNNSFSTNYFTDNGINVTDGPIFIWDNKKNNFKIYEIDESMY